MQLHSSDFVAGAASARGVTIVIDVFRACSLIAHALAAGAERVVPVAEIELARAMKAADPTALLMSDEPPMVDVGLTAEERAAIEAEEAERVERENDLDQQRAGEEGADDRA